MFPIEWLSIILISYLLGAIPTAYLITQIRGVNIFDIGSGNMGATNVARVMGIGGGILVWLLDMSKGAVAILLARQIMDSNMAWATVLAAVAAIVGHNWSIFVAIVTGKLRGGKGASVAFASLILIAPNIVVPVALVGVAILLLTRYVSLSVLVMFGVAILWLFVLISQKAMAPEYMIYGVMVAVLIAYRFRDNIQRLLTGTERRLGERA